MVGGPCIPKYEVDPPDWVDYFWSETGYGKTNGFLSLLDFGNEFKMIPPGYIYGCNYAILKKILLEYGGTQPDYYPEKYRAYQGTGESALALNLQRKGFWAVYNPKSRIEHLIASARLTLDYFCWRRYFNGIHTSYHDVRRRHGLEGYKADTISMLVQTVRRPLGHIKRYILRLLRIVSTLLGSFIRGLGQSDSTLRYYSILGIGVLAATIFGASSSDQILHETQTVIPFWLIMGTCFQMSQPGNNNGS